MSRCAWKGNRDINTNVEVDVVKAEELNKPEIVEIQPIEKKSKRIKNNQ